MLENFYWLPSLTWLGIKVWGRHFFQSLGTEFCSIPFIAVPSFLTGGFIISWVFQEGLLDALFFKFFHVENTCLFPLCVWYLPLYR